MPRDVSSSVTWWFDKIYTMLTGYLRLTDIMGREGEEMGLGLVA